MKIVVEKSTGNVVMVADMPSPPQDPALFDIHDLAGWDWSKVDMAGVSPFPRDGSGKPLPYLSQFSFNGTTLVKNP